MLGRHVRQYEDDMMKDSVRRALPTALWPGLDADVMVLLLVAYVLVVGNVVDAVVVVEPENVVIEFEYN